MFLANVKGAPVFHCSSDLLRATVFHLELLDDGLHHTRLTSPVEWFQNLRAHTGWLHWDLPSPPEAPAMPKKALVQNRCI